VELTIANKRQLDEWINGRRALNRDIVSIKGFAPEAEVEVG